MPKYEYRVVVVGADLEDRLNALAGDGFLVALMTDQRVVLLRTTSTTEFERTQRAQSVSDSATDETVGPVVAER